MEHGLARGAPFCSKEEHMSTFDRVSDQYASSAVVQKNAAHKLAGLLEISPAASIIDVACGPGHITAQLKDMTQSLVVGVDISEGMVRQAQSSYPDIPFATMAIEHSAYHECFDVAFCNSALQWFSFPEQAMQAMARSLKKGGRCGIACPGTLEWSPALMRVIKEVTQEPDIAPLFSHWRNPWFFLETAEAYQSFFERAGLKTNYIRVEHEKEWFTPEQAYQVYRSGAAQGFASGQYYDIEVSDEYLDSFNERVYAALKRYAENNSGDGKVVLDFNRMYYVGEK